MLRKSASNIDTNGEQWGLVWQPEGLYGNFTKEAILAHVPQTSGVYGLFNSNCQIFVGESGNIQHALLHHAKKTDFPSRHVQPTGFAFESCAEGLRKSKVAELIARYRPVLQNDTALTENTSPQNLSMATSLDRKDSQTDIEKLKFAIRDHRDPQRKGQRGHYRRTQRVMFSSIFAAGVVTVFCPDVPGYKNIQAQAHNAAGIRMPQVSVIKPTAAGEKFDRKLANLSINTAGTVEHQYEVPRPVKPHTHDDTSTVNRPAHFSDKSDLTANQKRVSKVSATMQNHARLEKKWSVQIAAVPSRDIAVSLVERLKANGYDGYIIQVIVNGETYYRVRAGHYETEERAKALHLSLVRRAGYQDAFLTFD